MGNVTLRVSESIARRMLRWLNNELKDYDAALAHNKGTQWEGTSHNVWIQEKRELLEVAKRHITARADQHNRTYGTDPMPRPSRSSLLDLIGFAFEEEDLDDDQLASALEGFAEWYRDGYPRDREYLGPDNREEVWEQQTKSLNN